MILIVIIAVIVTIFTAGAAAAAMGYALGTGAAAGTVVAGTAATGMMATMSLGAAVMSGAGLAALGATAGAMAVAGVLGAAFVGGVVGSAVSQEAAKHMGMREHFSLRESLTSGFTAMAAAGAGGYFEGAKYARAAQGAAAYMGNYAARVATNHEKTSFQWSGLASSVISSSLSIDAGGSTNLATNIAVNFYQGAVAATIDRLINHGGKQSWSDIAINAIGQGIGDTVKAYAQKSSTVDERARGRAETATNMEARNAGNAENRAIDGKTGGISDESEGFRTWGLDDPNAPTNENVLEPELVEGRPVRDKLSRTERLEWLRTNRSSPYGSAHDELVEAASMLEQVRTAYSGDNITPEMKQMVVDAVAQGDADNFFVRMLNVPGEYQEGYHPNELANRTADEQVMAFRRGITYALDNFESLLNRTYWVAEGLPVKTKDNVAEAILRVGSRGIESFGSISSAEGWLSIVPPIGVQLAENKYYEMNAIAEFEKVGLLSSQSVDTLTFEARNNVRDLGVTTALPFMGRVGGAIAVPYMFGSSGSAEAGIKVGGVKAASALGKLSKSSSIGKAFSSEIDDVLSKITPNATASNGKYGNIPAEHHARYDRYLSRNPKKVLSPDEWYGKAKTVWTNNKGGNSYEMAVREYLGVPIGKGSKPVSIDGFVPDLPVGGQYGVTDIKNVQHLTNSDQLKAFYQYAASNEMPFNIIISPKTQGVSKSVLDQIRNTNGKLFEFNLDKQALSPIDIGTKGAWKR